MTTHQWLSIHQAPSPLILAMPHGGTWIPPALLGRFVSPWAARRDADWHIGALYAGLADATIVATSVSRSVIDVNRDPSGASLYPGQATTALCPETDFDGAALYRAGEVPDAAEIAERRSLYFDPYHAALVSEVARLRDIHGYVIVYDCHSIRSRIPRLFDGLLPELNIGTNLGTTCAAPIAEAIMTEVEASGRSHVRDGRFRGGWTTRHYGRPVDGIHAVQMETALRAYLAEPDGAVTEQNWPAAWDDGCAEPLRQTLRRILAAAVKSAGTLSQ